VSETTHKQEATARRKAVAAVIGGARASEEVRRVAREVGEEIGRRGWHLLTGGGGGVMEAAGQGFLEGRTVIPIERRGVNIGLLPTDERDFANGAVEVVLPTGIGWARNAVIARAAQGIVAVGGCSGTLSEMAFAWQMGRPIAALGGSGGWSARLAGQRLDDRREEPVFAADDARSAVAYLAARLEWS
jgi:uncharacterized protein (TIGR00725 family)